MQPEMGSAQPLATTDDHKGQQTSKEKKMKRMVFTIVLGLFCLTTFHICTNLLGYELVRAC